MDSIEKDSLGLWVCGGAVGIGAYLVSRAARRCRQKAAAGGVRGAGAGAGPRSNSASAKARRRRTRSLHAGSFDSIRRLPADEIQGLTKIV